MKATTLRKGERHFWSRANSLFVELGTAFVIDRFCVAAWQVTSATHEGGTSLRVSKDIRPPVN